MDECQLYQLYVTKGMIYQISGDQPDVKGQTFCEYKKAVLKYSNDTIKVHIVVKKLYSLPKKKKIHELVDNNI